MRPNKSLSQLPERLYHAVPFALLSASAVCFAVACAKDPGSTRLTKLGGGDAAKATSAMKTLDPTYDPTSADNVALSMRVEGITSLVSPTTVGVGSSSSAPTGAPDSAAAASKRFDVKVSVLVQDEDDTKPAFQVIGEGLMSFDPATAKIPDSQAAGVTTAQAAVQNAASSTTVIDAGDSTDQGGDVPPTAPPAAPASNNAQATTASAPAPGPVVTTGLLSLLPESSDGTSGRFAIYARCADQDCAALQVFVWEKTKNGAGTMVKRKAYFQFAQNPTEAKDAPVRTMQLSYSSPGKATTPARGGKPGAQNIAEMKPSFDDAKAARQKQGKAVKDGTGVSAPAPVAGSQPQSSGTLPTPSVSAGTLATAPVTTGTAAHPPMATAPVSNGTNPEDSLDQAPDDTAQPVAAPAK